METCYISGMKKEEKKGCKIAIAILSLFAVCVFVSRCLGKNDTVSEE